MKYFPQIIPMFMNSVFLFFAIQAVATFYLACGRWKFAQSELNREQRERLVDEAWFSMITSAVRGIIFALMFIGVAIVTQTMNCY